MLSNFFQGLQVGGKAAEIFKILNRTYFLGLSAQDGPRMDLLMGVAAMPGSADELALVFIGQLFSENEWTMANPAHAASVLRIANTARELNRRGLLSNSRLFGEFSEGLKERFGLIYNIATHSYCLPPR